MEGIEECLMPQKVYEGTTKGEAAVRVSEEYTDRIGGVSFPCTPRAWSYNDSRRVLRCFADRHA
jgi:hypothetical protein